LGSNVSHHFRTTERCRRSADHITAASLTKSYVSFALTFDYAASAELFATQGRAGLRYRRFARAAEAIRNAMEKVPTKVLSGTSIEVNDKRYNATQIRNLYESHRYALARKYPPM
jgi:hypothetical protein